jgi:hypothetical protein
MSTCNGQDLTGQLLHRDHIIGQNRILEIFPQKVNSAISDHIYN